MNEERKAGQVRRVITGHDEKGRAVVIEDGLAPVVHTAAKRPGYASTEIWRTNESPAKIGKICQDDTAGPRRQLPATRGTVVRINTLAPESEQLRNLTSQEAQGIFSTLGNPNASTYATSGRHPLMHRTETIDYAIVLSGEVTMVLDDSEVVLRAGDVLVQCGTNHAWSNRGSVPCQIAFVLVDGQFDPELQTALSNLSAS